MRVATLRAAGAALAAAVLVSCAGAPPAPPPADLARDTAGQITADAMYVHLRALQEIADANGGTRAEGTPGYDASVDYVVKVLRDSGFDVQTPEFERVGITRGGNPGLTVAGRTFPAEQASLLHTTPRGGLTAITLRPPKPAGCTAADYGTVKVAGAIAVVDDLGCSVVVKHDVAVGKGAVGLLVVSPPRPNGSPAGLYPEGYYRGLQVPVGIITPDADAALRRTNAPVRLVLDRQPVAVSSRNVVAQTGSGDPRNVVMVGAHLDGIAGGPGINDNGSGVAAVLATAAALGAQPGTANAVRFAFWGSEEPGVAGSSAYVRALTRDELNDIALYLNVDMIGSPNAGYFTYDGDQSAQPSPDVSPADVPEGSAGIERMLAGYLSLAGVRPADMPLSKTRDDAPFLRAGVPIGGVTTGSSQRKTEVQARLWGGRAGVAFDPNYHTRRDDITNVNRDAIAVMGPAVGFAVATYAQSTDGVNGVPPRDDRRRTPAGP